MSGPTFNNYLRHIQPVSLQGQVYTVAVPSDFVKDWLVRRFARRIEETLEQFQGRATQLAFVGASEAPQPATQSDEPALSEAEGRIAALQAEEARLSGDAASTPPDDPQSVPPETFIAPSRFAPPKPERKPARDGGRDTSARDAGLEDFSFKLNKKYTFDNFIVGRSNYVSHAASWAVANAPAKGQYNPLFIYGGVGLGKTHLMQAIGHHVNANRSNPAEIVYVSGENFLYQVGALHPRRPHDGVRRCIATWTSGWWTTSSTSATPSAPRSSSSTSSTRSTTRASRSSSAPTSRPKSCSSPKAA
jgi:chromosomal replication initiator protein